MTAVEQDGKRPNPEPAGAPPAEKRSSGLGRWALAALLVGAFGGFYALGLHHYLSWEYLRTHLDVLQTEVRQHLPLALLAFFAAYVAVTALSLPVAALLSLVGGALFGRWLGTGVIVLAATLGATLAFLSARYLLQGLVQRRFGTRLEALNRGVERDGAFYLFSLRLVPLFPFFLVNLGMGLTRLRVWTFAWVSLLGMLPGTFLYVNAGTALATIDSPGDILSPGVLISLALLGVLPLALRKFLQWKARVRLRTLMMAVGVLLLLAAGGIALRQYLRYRVAEVMDIAVKEFSNAEYPEDPANRSPHHGQYNGRKLTLVRKDATHFDFVLEPSNDHTARIIFKGVDVSLMTPGLPKWVKGDADLERIALTDRQWNRQQVSFDRKSPHLQVTGGNGFEQKHLFSAELAKNCLNAGLWEVLLFEKGADGQKALYYQGWFTFPLGHYQDVFEHTTGLNYWSHWYYLEHWFDPAGTPVRLAGLRQVRRERKVRATYDGDEPVLAAGEQVRKQRTTLAENILTWKDFYDGRRVRFATFIPPGRYSVRHPWKNAYWRMDRFAKAILREIVSPATAQPLSELELVFESTQGGGKVRFLVGGFDLSRLPRLPVVEYAQGLYMPMGIGVPPFFQSYEELRKTPPERSPYFSVMLDAEGQWINHHDLAIDGPVLHRDQDRPHLLHVYLLSYERHSLVGHLVIDTRG